MAVRRVRGLLLLALAASGCVSATGAPSKEAAQPRTPSTMDAYASNVVRAIARRWEPPAGPDDRKADIAFFLDRMGKVIRYEWIERSGDGVFDRTARAAIQGASDDGAFGPLPDSFEPDSMKIIFTFDPS